LSAHISFSTPIPPATLSIPVVLDVAFVVPVRIIEPLVVFPLDVTCCKLPTFVAVATMPVNPLPSP
jgi:hypothetical protein